MLEKGVIINCTHDTVLRFLPPLNVTSAEIDKAVAVMDEVFKQLKLKERMAKRMPKRTDIKSILVIGSGPIIIGQAAEFDYAGTQTCLALREEGYKVILVNSNPATIMTDVEIADKVYMEPLTLEFIANIIRKERPDALLPTLGGQTGLNMAVELDETGILKEYKVELLGTKLTSIQQAEDRDLFRQLMAELHQPVPESDIIHNGGRSASSFAAEIGYPLIVRPAFTMGGTGGGICHNEADLREIVANGLRYSPVTQCLLEKSIAGFKGNRVRSNARQQRQMPSLSAIWKTSIRSAFIQAIPSSWRLPKRCPIKNTKCCAMSPTDHPCALKIEGGCNVQLALDPYSFDYYIIEVNPRVSRSSALASKATGYPIAKMAAKIAVGLTLDEMKNPVTGTSCGFRAGFGLHCLQNPAFPVR